MLQDRNWVWEHGVYRDLVLKLVQTRQSKSPTGEEVGVSWNPMERSEGDYTHPPSRMVVDGADRSPKKETTFLKPIV